MEVGAISRMTLSAYLTDCILALDGQPSLDLFLELRYHKLVRLFPHDIFSVAQASLDFFDTALAHLNGAPFDDPDNPPKEKPSVYEMNYRRWILANRA